MPVYAQNKDPDIQVAIISPTTDTRRIVVKNGELKDIQIWDFVAYLRVMGY